MKDATFREQEHPTSAPCKENGEVCSQKTVRLSPHAELIRERLALRLEKLGEISPVSLDLAAGALAVLHDRLNGKVKNLSADHTADYAGQMIRGDKVLGLTRLCYMLDQEPNAVIDALQEILAPYCAMIVRIPCEVKDVDLENSDFLREFGEFQAMFSEARSKRSTGGEDITEDERYRLLQQLKKMIREANQLGPALRNS